MTVLGLEKEKSDDKEKLVGKNDVATIMPNRIRLLKFQRRRSIITLLLSIGFLFIFLCGIFLTVCYIKKIGPFRRHFLGTCQVGSKRFNGHSRVFESYEITDKYALIHVPRFNFKHGTFDSVRTLHVFDKKLTVIQHQSMCFVKPMLKYQTLRSDWFDKLRMLSHHHFRTPNRFAYYHLQIIRPQLSGNFLLDKVHHLAAAMCNSRPVFSLEYQIHPEPYPWLRMCNIKCYNCDVSEQVYSWKMLDHRKCRVCQCKARESTASPRSLKSSNQVDSKCKSIRCENKCVNKKLIGCVRCRCADEDQVTGQPVTNDHYLDQMVVHDKDDQPKYPTESSFVKEKYEDTTNPNGHNRKKRSVASNTNCTVIAKIFEGYTPLDYYMKVPLDYIHDC